MTPALLAVLGLGVLIATVNGANDVSKGIATLVGSGVTDYRRAVLWGTVWTGAGGLAGAVFAGAMVSTFGHGLLGTGAAPTFATAIATILGAALWVLVATRTGLPVSTTHAIVGSLAGVALLASGVEGVRWSALGGKLLLPLLVSPIASLGITLLALRLTRPEPGGGEPVDCACAELVPGRSALVAGAPALSMTASTLHLVTGPTQACALERPAAARLTLGHLHWLTSGAASFARGMNDAPKMVALVLAATALLGGPAVGGPALFALVTLGMVAGSLVAGRRVTQVLAREVTPMDAREGFWANLVTSGLVIAGAVGGLPMSTTHVSSGSIIAAGVQRPGSTVNRRTLRNLVLAWVVTLPAAAVLGMASLLVARAIRG